LPLIAYFVSSILIWLAYLSRPVTQKPLLLVLERLESSSSGTCTMIAGAVAVIIAVLTAWQKA
jgi:hypothetical protein